MPIAAAIALAPCCSVAALPPNGHRSRPALDALVAAQPQAGEANALGDRIRSASRGRGVDPGRGADRRRGVGGLGARIAADAGRR
jgi:hypothetical protein